MKYFINESFSWSRGYSSEQVLGAVYGLPRGCVGSYCILWSALGTREISLLPFAQYVDTAAYMVVVVGFDMSFRRSAGTGAVGHPTGIRTATFPVPPELALRFAPAIAIHCIPELGQFVLQLK